MPTFHRTLVALGTALALCACSDDPRDTVTTTTAPRAAAGADVALSAGSVPGKRAGIAESAARLEAAWNAGDANAFAAEFAPDTRYITPTGALLLSREAVRQQHVFLFGPTGPFNGSTLTTVSFDIAFLTGTLAVLERVTDVTNFRFNPGLPPYAPGVLRLRVRSIHEFRGGAWTMTHYQITGVVAGN